MCIVLLSTSHPKYSLILIANRDEYLLRPTATASFWKPPAQQVLGGRDLHREVQGTWLGVTTDGRIAALTNFHEETSKVHGQISRGAMVNAFLIPPPEAAIGTGEFVKALATDEAAKGSGGFSLLCGKIGEPLAIVSNRASKEDDVVWVASERNEIIGLSNAAFSDHSWPKVLRGEELLRLAIVESLRQDMSPRQLVDRLLDVLSDDTLPKRRGEAWETYVAQLRNSIFIPKLGDDIALAEAADAVAAADASSLMTFDPETAIVYGTQKQTVILVDLESNLTFVERSLYGDDGRPIEPSGQEKQFSFKIIPSS